MHCSELRDLAPHPPQKVPGRCAPHVGATALRTATFQVIALLRQRSKSGANSKQDHTLDAAPW
ncbi:hypothetical protein GCM10023159_23310 [Brevibacterium yomogidense]